MSEAFSISGESSDITAGPAPQLQGLFIPGIDNSQFVDGFGVVTPWGGGGTARRYGDYGIPAEISRQSTQLNDLASSLIPAEGGAAISFEGLIGPQGLRGEDGTTLIIHESVGLNSNFLAALPHNIDLINDLGTAVDQMIYTDTYNAYAIDVLTWTERQPAGDVNRNWQRVASDADGSHLIAAAYSGRLYTSADYGVNWTERQPAGAANKNWFSVASDSDGSHLIAGIGGASGGGGRLYTSADYGVNWTERQPAGDVERQWDAVASDDNGSHLIAAAYNGRVYMSTNYGVNWTERTPTGSAENKNWFSVASDADGSNLIIGAISGRLYTSDDAGVSWLERQPAGDFNRNWRAVASDSNGSNLIVGVSNYRLYTSANAGAGWTERQPAGDINYNWEMVASDADGSYLMAGIDGKRLYISVDSGASWVETQPAGDTNMNWYDAACDSDGSHSIVGAESGRLYTRASGIYSEPTWAETTITSAGRALMDDTTAAAQRTTLGLVIGTDVQAWDAGLDSLAALTYASDSFIKVTAENTYAIRTIAETKTDLSLNLVENTAHSTDAHTMTIDGRDVSVDGTKLDGIEALADVTATNETSHATVLVDADFGSAGLMNTDGAGTYSIKAIGTDVQAYHANLAAIAGGTWTGAASITTLGTIATIGNITIADGGTIGQAAGPLLTFNDTSDYLALSGCGAQGFRIHRVSDDINAPILSFLKERTTGQACQDNDYAGGLLFGFYNDAGTPESVNAARIRVKILDASDGTEDAHMDFRTIVDGTLTTGLTILGTQLVGEGSLSLKEQAAAVDDTAAYGQIWVKNDAPTTLWFTDDTGVDHQIAYV